MSVQSSVSEGVTSAGREEARSPSGQSPTHVQPADANGEASAPAGDAVAPAAEEVAPAEAVEPATSAAAVSATCGGLAPSATGVVQPSSPEANVSPASCGCQAEPDGTKVFALGELSYDFGTEARLDYFVQQLGSESNALDPVEMASFLGEEGSENAENANALIWTLNIDATPVYAIRPDNEFAVMTYLRLVRFLVDQEKHGVERVSAAGHISGTTRLFNGTLVPTISPVLRGMHNWNSEDLIGAIFNGGKSGGEESAKAPGGEAGAAHEAQTTGVLNFMQRVYYELRNLGTSAQDRAMNYAATNAFQLKEVFEDAFKEDLQLDRIGVEPSPICRPDSDCWDVKLQFFDPVKIHERARKVYRYTIDVSDVVPVTVGKLRTWYVY